MALPSATTVINYSATLPKSQKEVKYRPFLLKEKKILLMAKETNDEQTKYNSIRQVLDACSLGGMPVDKEFDDIDIEYMLLQLLVASHGATSNVGMKCRKHIKIPERHHPIKGLIPAYEGPCNHVSTIPVDLSNPIIEGLETDNKIMLKSDLGLTMKPVDRSKLAISEDMSIDDVLEIVYPLVDNIFDSEKIYKGDDIKRESLIPFFDTFNDDQLKMVVEYITKVPTIKVDVNFKCEKCGHTDSTQISGIQSFFK